MVRIDCSVTVNYSREYARMCKYYTACVKCHECPMGSSRNEKGYNCKILLFKHPETAIDIVQRWSDEHPQKTRLDDLLEKCPNVSLDGEGIPCFSPSMLGYCGDCVRCRNWKNPDARNCWNEPVDGGATGKAVE